MTVASTALPRFLKQGRSRRLAPLRAEGVDNRPVWSSVRREKSVVAVFAIDRPDPARRHVHPHEEVVPDNGIAGIHFPQEFRYSPCAALLVGENLSRAYDRHELQMLRSSNQRLQKELGSLQRSHAVRHSSPGSMRSVGGTGPADSFLAGFNDE